MSSIPSEGGRVPPTYSPLVTLRKVWLSVDAEVIVALTGDIMTMPGLPRMPSANDIYLNKSGEIEGLF